MPRRLAAIPAVLLAVAALTGCTSATDTPQPTETTKYVVERNPAPVRPAPTKTLPNRFTPPPVEPGPITGYPIEWVTCSEGNIAAATNTAKKRTRLQGEFKQLILCDRQDDSSPVEPFYFRPGSEEWNTLARLLARKDQAWPKDQNIACTLTVTPVYRVLAVTDQGAYVAHVPLDYCQSQLLDVQDFLSRFAHPPIRISW